MLKQIGELRFRFFDDPDLKMVNAIIEAGFVVVQPSADLGNSSYIIAVEKEDQNED